MAAIATDQHRYAGHVARLPAAGAIQIHFHDIAARCARIKDCVVRADDHRGEIPAQLTQTHVTHRHLIDGRVDLPQPQMLWGRLAQINQQMH